MKILPKHRKVFKQCLDHFQSYCSNWICSLIDWSTNDLNLRKECKDILFFYFQDEPRLLLWLSTKDNLTYQEVEFCRILALQSLISMDT